MLSLPKGELYINEVKKTNLVAMTDNPVREEIAYFFRNYPNAEKLIYKCRATIKEYTRKDYV